jgi:DNA-binding MurR/RpiR family transcriptional regulator
MENEIDHYSKIRSSLSSMSATQQKIANYIVENSELVSGLTITQLARKLGVDPATISRFCQFLGFKGYADFRFSMFHHLVSPQIDQFAFYNETDTVSELLEKMQSNGMRIWKDVFQLIDPKQIERAVKLIYNSRAIYIFAAGGTMGTALFAQKMFLHIGIQCHVYSDIILAMPASEHLNREDTVIGISYSGEGRVVVESVKNAKKRKAHIIGITGFQNSELAKLSDLIISYNLRIPNDLMYIHMTCMIEVTIMGMLQNVILTRYHKELDPFLRNTRDAIKAALN